MIRFILRVLVGALGLWIASRLVHGISVDSLGSLLAAALLLGLANAIVRPIVIFLTLPFVLLTLGLFLLVINAAMLGLVSLFLHGFHVHGLVAAVLGSIVVSIVSWIGHLFLGKAHR